MELPQARILEWVAIPFSRGSFWPRDGTQVSCIAGRYLLYHLSHKGSPQPSQEFCWKEQKMRCREMCSQRWKLWEFRGFWLCFLIFTWRCWVLVGADRILAAFCRIFVFWHVGSVVSALRLSCSMACGISVLLPGIELVSLVLQGEFLTSRPPGEVPGVQVFWERITRPVLGPAIKLSVLKKRKERKRKEKKRHFGVMFIWDERYLECGGKNY